ncbi:MAG: hypothetical protein U7127_11355 [Phormidium sp.]
MIIQISIARRNASAFSGIDDCVRSPSVPDADRIAYRKQCLFSPIYANKDAN